MIKFRFIRIDKILFSFVFSIFCLLISVSSADIVADEFYVSDSSAFSFSSSSASLVLEGYSPANIAGAVKSYIVNGDDTLLKPILDDLSNKGFSKTVIYRSMNGSFPRYEINIFPDEFDFDFTYFNLGTLDTIGLYASSDSYYYRFWEDRNTYWGSTRTQTTDSYAYIYNAFSTPTSSNSNHFIVFNNMSVKTVTYSSGYYVWDGISYFYKDSSSDDSDIPTFPTNAEIASAVQMFYDSDYYKNATDFDKFIVLYDNTTGLYSIIGHTIPEFLQQVIIPPNHRYQGYIYDVQWWKFEVNENSGAPAYGTPYYLYVIDHKLETLQYRGKNTISSLVESGPWATANSIIVYSNYDYLVRTYVLDEETGDYVYTDGVIAGNQYTYDENLDVTNNNYNPLDNFVTVDYPSTLVGNADFESFLNMFNENKDFLVLPQNANWIILANTSLFSYFGSFIIMCTLFIIIERIMRG